jgi:hypothetical protein
VESEALKAELKKARGLLAIASVIGGATDLIEAFRLISKELAALSGAETVSAYVLDHAGAELRPMAGYHIPREALPVLGTATLPLVVLGFAATVSTPRAPYGPTTSSTTPGSAGTCSGNIRTCRAS